MLSLDLFDSKFEKRLHEGAVDNTIEHLLKPLSLRAAEIRTQLRSGGLNPKQIDQLEKEYEDLVQKRLDIMLDRQQRTEQQQPSRPPAKGLLKGKDLITPQQRVAGATPTKPGIGAAVKDVAGGVKRWLKGEPDQGPTYEARQKKSPKNSQPSDIKVARELQKIRAQYPTATSDLEALARHELDNSENTQAELTQLQRQNNQQTQQLAQLQAANTELQQTVNSLDQITSQLTQRTQPATTATPTPPTTSAPAAVKPAAPIYTEPVAKEPEAVPAQLPKKDKKLLPRVRDLQRQLEKRVDQYQTVRALRDTEKMEKMQKAIADLQARLDTETAKMSDQGQQVAQRPGAEVIDITSRLKGAGLELPRTGTLGEQQSPVIGSMVQQIEKQANLKMSPQEMYDKNMTAFTTAYNATRGTKLNFGGSAQVPLPFTDMDAMVSVITAFPDEEKKQIWFKLFTDPNYLNGFLQQYVKQAGLIEADVIPLAQQRQAPAELKAYNLALQIMKAARDPNIPANKVDMMKQSLFKDFGTRIQRHPEGYYYMVFQGKPKRLPDPDTFALEEHGGGIGPRQHWQDLMKNEGWSDKYNPTPYAVYIDGRQWKKFRSDEEARRVADKVRANLKLQGRGQQVTIAPSEKYLQNKLKEEQLLEGIKDTASATAVIACLLTGGSLSGCATAPQQTSAQQVLKTGQDMGRTVQTAKRITRAGVEAEVNQEIRNLLRGIGGRPEELNHSNILRIWRRINQPTEPQNEAVTKIPKTAQERDDMIDKIQRMMIQDRNPANRQIMQKDIELLKQQYAHLKEDTAALAAEDAILKRIFVKHRDLMMEYGPDKITQAAESVAYNVGDIAHITDDQINEWVGQVEQILGARP